MSEPTPVLAVLGRGIVPIDTPILRGDDRGAVRGDGIFETMHVRARQAWLLDAHLARMARSAQALEIALPPAPVLRELVGLVLAEWPADAEGALRLICTRGPEDGDEVTVYATALPVPEAMIRARRDGVAVATATLGVPARLRADTPWLLGGAKTLSYAVNMACLRWAKTVGADDVLWVSTDGYALEAPTASLVWLDGDTLRTVPASTGVLAGTTAAQLLACAGELGLDRDEGLITPQRLATAEGAWLTSAIRGAVPIRRLDGAPVRYDAVLSDRIRTLLGFPLPG